MKYDISVLHEAANEYFSAKEMFKDHIRNKAKKIADPKICGGKAGWELWRMVYERELSDKYEALRNMCELVYADINAVIAIEKSIRRYTQYQLNWEREPHLGYYEDGYYRVVERKEYWTRYYKSAGRRWNF